MYSRFVYLFIFVISSCFALSAWGQSDYDWMPVPKSWEEKSTSFRLAKDFKIGIKGPGSRQLETYATRVLRRLDHKTGLFFPQKEVDATVKDPHFIISVQRKGELVLGEDESYLLTIEASGILLEGETEIGAMRGMETLVQLLQGDDEGFYFPGIVVADAPRFPWRGLMIDVSRHFQPVEVIKRNLDGMAAVKMNVLHLHLVDDHGFRVESKRYPALHEKASKGQYFTQLEVQEIVEYAADRGIRVVPEFDVPGHASSFLTAFPELGSAPGPYRLQDRSGIFDPTLNPTEEATYTFLNNLFTEMSALFPDRYFHIGGDENEGKHWMENEAIQAFMVANKLGDVHALQSYFVKRIQQHLKTLDKKMIGWDEILTSDLPRNAIVHSWRGIEAMKVAAQNGYQSILSNGFYIDLMKRASDHYETDPIPRGLELSGEARKNILGGEATMWSELVTPASIDSRIWPRTAAIAERLWSPADARDVDEMYRRLPFISLELERLGLTHLSNREAMMRNLANGYDVASLRTLANVAEPLEGYNRNPEGKLYQFHNAFNRFADITLADASDARAFEELVSAYQLQRDAASKGAIVEYLERWKANHQKIVMMQSGAPGLTEVLSLSENLKNIAAIGLASFEIAGSNLTNEQRRVWYQEAMESLDKAKEQGARTELQVVEPIRKLVKLGAAQIHATRTTGEITVDGDLKEWQNVEWDYFLPLLIRGWNDTCHYAVQWDEEQLYFAFKVTNRDIRATKHKRDESGFHLDDGIEILIDTQHDRSLSWSEDDLAYRVNVLNAIMDDKGLNKGGEYNNAWNGQARSNVTVHGTINNSDDRDKGYWIEFSIDWKELGRKPDRNTILGINVCVNDQNDLHREHRHYDYMGLSVFRVPAGFADLVLVE